MIDASSAVRLVMRSAEASDLIVPLRAAGVVMAPRLFVAEVGNALWKYCRHERLAPDDAQRRLAEGVSLADHLEEDEHLIHEALLEASRLGHPVYDCLYAVTARRHGAALLTRDARLGKLAQGLGLVVLPDRGEG